MPSLRSRRGGGRGFPPTLIRGFKGGEIQRGYAPVGEYLVPDGLDNMGLSVWLEFYMDMKRNVAEGQLTMMHGITDVAGFMYLCTTSRATERRRACHGLVRSWQPARWPATIRPIGKTQHEMALAVAGTGIGGGLYRTGSPGDRALHASYSNTPACDGGNNRTYRACFVTCARD